MQSELFINSVLIGRTVGEMHEFEYKGELKFKAYCAIDAVYSSKGYWIGNEKGGNPYQVSGKINGVLGWEGKYDGVNALSALQFYVDSKIEKTIGGIIGYGWKTPHSAVVFQDSLKSLKKIEVWDGGYGKCLSGMKFYFE